MADIIDGKMVASLIKEEIKTEVDEYLHKGLCKPILTAILVGDDPASQVYVRNKEKACEKCGFESHIIRLPDTTTQEELDYNIDIAAKCSDGIIVQLPLPNGLNANHMEKYPQKDVDGFTRNNMGKLVLGEDCFIPATPYGITMLLDYYNIPTQGKNVVIVGRSNIVGKPMANLLMNKPYNATVTVCHSKTPAEEMSYLLSNADIIIMAIGKPEWLTLDKFYKINDFAELKNTVTIIDVGINRVETEVTESNPKGYRLVGDVDYDDVEGRCGWITPVPGGVGPMTICGLMKNTLKAYKNTFDPLIC